MGGEMGGGKGGGEGGGRQLTKCSHWFLHVLRVLTSLLVRLPPLPVDSHRVISYVAISKQIMYSLHPVDGFVPVHSSPTQ